MSPVHAYHRRPSHMPTHGCQHEEADSHFKISPSTTSLLLNKARGSSFPDASVTPPDLPLLTMWRVLSRLCFGCVTCVKPILRCAPPEVPKRVRPTKSRNGSGTPFSFFYNVQVFEALENFVRRPLAISPRTPQKTKTQQKKSPNLIRRFFLAVLWFFFWVLADVAST